MTDHNPCHRREMAVSTNNVLVNGHLHNLLMLFFPYRAQKFEIFETFFSDTVIT